MKHRFVSALALVAMLAVMGLTSGTLAGQTQSDAAQIFAQLPSVIPSEVKRGGTQSRMERPGKPRHRREGRRLSEREVS